LFACLFLSLGQVFRLRNRESAGALGMAIVG
jgi:hypothetical protein